MRVYSPEGRLVPLSFAGPARPQSLDGLRIGLLDNTKNPVDKMMEHLARRLSERLPNSAIFSVSKDHPSLPAEPEVMSALRANADVLINALGD